MQLAAQGDVPPVEVFEKITCPVECVRELTAVAKTVGYRFPSTHAALRRLRLQQAKQQRNPDGRFPTWAEIAERIALHRSRVYQLVAEMKSEPATSAPSPTPECAAPPTLPSAAEPLVPARSCKTVGGADSNLTVPVSATTEVGQPS